MKPSADVLFKQLGEEAVLLDLGSSKYFSLNRTGTVIWGLVEEGVDISSMVDELSRRFGVDEGTARKDVVDLLDELHSAGLIVTVDT